MTTEPIGMLSWQSTTKTGPGNTSPGHQTSRHQVPGGFTSLYSPTSITLVFTNLMTWVTPDAPRRESQEVIEHMESEDRSSAQSWRRDTNHPHSKLQKAPKTISTLQLQSLQDKIAKATYVEESALLSSGWSRKRLFLSRGGNDLENLETQVSQRGMYLSN